MSTQEQQWGPILLGLLAFVAILMAWSFITDLVASITASIASPVTPPGTLNALIFVIAAFVAVYLYMKFEG